MAYVKVKKVKPGTEEWRLKMIKTVKPSSPSRHAADYGEPFENKIYKVEAQRFKCANLGCGTDIDYWAGHQDHNHDTGEVRGVLCRECNLTLGHSSESAARLEGLAAYIRCYRGGTKLVPEGHDSQEVLYEGNSGDFS